jgi:hypothetical protein
VISGTPTAGAPSFTIQLSDSAGASTTKVLSISVAAAVSITTNSLPNATVGAGYSTTLASSGGTSPLAWSVSAGSLPAGLSLASATGVISGTPTASAPGFTIRLSDGAGASTTKVLSIAVAAAPSITTTSLPTQRSVRRTPLLLHRREEPRL